MSTRRDFSKQILTLAGATTFTSPLFSQNLIKQFSKTNNKKLGIALVGLGGYSTRELAPALDGAEFCELKGIVTGTPSKAIKWKKKYDLKESNIFNYENYDELSKNKDIDIVYVVLPNSMHKEYTIRALRAGKHVICEKPMALNAIEAQEMIDVAKKVGKKLFIGYRLHYDPFHSEIMRLCDEKVYGSVKVFEGGFGFRIGNPSQWRLNHSLAGGGALMDVGIYVIQAARYTIGEEPISLTAQEIKTDKVKFNEVDETILWQMNFPSGAVASNITTYATNINRFYLGLEKGRIQMSPSYTYRGLAGVINGKPMNISPVNQQQKHMDGIAYSLLSNTKAKNIYGDEGLKDMKVIDAIYKAVKSGKEEAI